MNNISDPCSLIVPGLWIGSLASLRTLHQDIPGTKQWIVVSLLSNEKLVSISKILLASSPALVGCHHEVWRLSDSCQEEFLSPRLVSILNLIDESTTSSMMSTTDNENNDGALPRNKACLVHCAQGVSRSAAVCAAWLISRKKLCLADALDEIRRARNQISPNLGFLASLRALEKCDGDVKKAMERLARKDNQGVLLKQDHV